MQRLIDRLRRATVSRRSYAVQYRPELSVVSDEASGLFLARIVNLEIAPGRGAVWTAFLERSLPSFQGAGVVFGVYQRMLGPGPVVWQLVENYQSFSELAQPDDRRAGVRGAGRHRGVGAGRRRHLDRADGAALRRRAELLLRAAVIDRAPHPGGDTMSIALYQLAHLFSVIMLAAVVFGRSRLLDPSTAVKR